MTAHLMLVTIGPVQDFIAQARRTRDLWHGSHLISELSRALARALADAGAQLLVPALDASDLGLSACWAPVRPETGEPPQAISNKIWAVVPADRDPRALAKTAREAALGCMRAHAETVWAKLHHRLPHDVAKVWREQVADALEFNAGWLALAGHAFADVRAQLDDGVAARKRLRDFHQSTHQREGQRKSSLDGARESVLPRRKSPARIQLQREIGLGTNEELDAIGLIKRAGADPERFIPLVNVALGPWLRHAARHHPALLDACRDSCEALGVQRLRAAMLGDEFRFEASVLLPDRWDALAEEQGYDSPELAGPWAHTRAAVTTLRAAAQAPRDEPYVACLVADGDRMGDAIARLRDPESLRQFSAELSSFARQVRALVREAGGSLVYAGGDDVLAFVPVEAATRCAANLRACFNEVVGRGCAALGLVDADHPPPSLSVGVGVGHYMESMGSLLELGREAERMAKGADLPRTEQRNALAIVVDKRAGGRRRWRARWGDDPCARLDADRALLAQLAVTKIHEIAAIVRRLPAQAEPPFDAKLSQVLAGELARALARNDGGPLDPRAVGIRLANGSYADAHLAAREWIDRLLIARELGRASLHSAETEADS